MVQIVHATIPAEGSENAIGYAEWAEAHTVTDLGIADVTGLQAALTATQLPVGSVFLTIGNTNPGTLLGYGTWVLRASGRALVGA